MFTDDAADIRVGACQISAALARFHVTSYLTASAKKPSGYPGYDGYEPRQHRDLLSDADLLAPTLLNARVSIAAFYGLQRQRAYLEDNLLRIDHDAELQGEGADPSLLGQLFSILDGDGVPDVRGALLAKVLHRKRPAFIPLYDKYVGWCYRDAPGAPVEPTKGRTWAVYVVELAQAIRRDLVDQLPLWQELAAITSNPPITPLRAIHIVAWRAGKRARRRRSHLTGAANR